MATMAKDDRGHLWWTATGRGCIAHLAGEIDLANASQLFAAIRAGRADTAPLTVDLTDVTFLDSTGVAEVIRLAGEAELCVVSRPDTQPRRVLRITRVDSLVSVLDSVDVLE